MTTGVTYRLDEPSTGNVIFDKQISASYTAELGDSFLGVERLRLANEGAAKTNIDIFIDELITLELNDSREQ